MASGFTISEETPDRNYFTIVPNYIINHSTIWERDIYLIMKRLAGEKGTCFASQQTIADRTGVSRPTISRTIKKLIKRGWIREIGKMKAKTHPTKNYLVVDLWKFNTDFYEQKKRKPQNQTVENGIDMSTTEPKIRKPQIHKEEKIEEDNNNNIIPVSSKNGLKCPNTLGHKNCISSLKEIEREFNKRFSNFPKQINAYHKLLRSGFTEKQIGYCLNVMDEEDFWKENGWDMMNVVNLMSKGGGKYVLRQN